MILLLTHRFSFLRANLSGANSRPKVAPHDFDGALLFVGKKSSTSVQVFSKQ